tara:strand:- start:119 stop:2032 length:1914 start_codon:yes stop_codon:yes gene_type:complete
MKLNYRPDIDGLRAISVFAVIFYHANFLVYDYPIFRGGFIGVDIFFVISGYLITSLILRELILNNSFSILNFYLRRIRRIIPVLFVVILICIPFSYFFFLPSSLIDFAKSALSSLAFSSNFFFHHTGLIYGGPDSSLKPLLHTWSLSVEEQFYIFFPIVLIFFNKYFNTSIFKFLILIFLISFFSTQLISSKFPLYNFYFINVRIWELLAGSIIAYLEIKHIKFKIFFFTNYLSFIGFILIFISIFLLNDEMSLPSIYSLPAVFGTCLIIFFSDKNNFIFKFLSLRWLVFSGLISYSLYLWHYPLFAFYNYVYFSYENNLIKLFIILISILLSIISYFFIEKPFRNKRIVNTKKLLMFIFTLFFLIIISCISIIFTNQKGQKGLFEKVNLDNLIYVSEVSVKLNEIKLNNNFINKKNNLIKNILIIGNSHAEDTFLIFKTNSDLFPEYNFEYSSLEFLSDKVLKRENIKKDFFQFSKYFESADIILFSNRWSKNDIEKLQILIEPLIKTKKEIIIFNENITLPSVGKRDVTLLDKFIINKKRLPNDQEIINLEKNYFDYVVNDNKRNKYNNKLNILSKKYGLKFLDKSLYQCDYYLKRCKVLTNINKKINYNTHHHTLDGIKYLGKKIYNTGWFKIN